MRYEGDPLGMNIVNLEAQTTKRYTEIAKDYNKDWRGQHDGEQLACLRQFENLVGNAPKTILDAGCGTGKDSVFLASEGYKVVGLDLSSGMLEKMVENTSVEGVKASAIIGNMRSLPFPDCSFDGVWNAASLVHLSPEAKKEAVGEFYRVLKPGGILHIWVQNLLSPKHLKRVIQSYFCHLGYDAQNKFYIRPKNVGEIFSSGSLIERVRRGYAYLDKRYWFYPTKTELVGSLRDEGFSIIESNQILSRRLSVFARK